MRKALMLLFVLGAITACKKHRTTPTLQQTIQDGFWVLTKGNDAWTNHQLFTHPDTSQNNIDFALSLLGNGRYYQRWNRALLDTGTYTLTDSVLHLSSEATFGQQFFLVTVQGDALHLTDNIIQGDYLTYGRPIMEY